MAEGRKVPGLRSRERPCRQRSGDLKYPNLTAARYSCRQSSEDQTAPRCSQYSGQRYQPQATENVHHCRRDELERIASTAVETLGELRDHLPQLPRMMCSIQDLEKP